MPCGCLAEHSAKSMINAEVVFFFIENEPRRVQHLSSRVAHWHPRLPATAKVHVREGSFDGSMTDVLDDLNEQGRRMAPALVMIDPFGVKGMPMQLIRRILANPMCEVYVSFMWEAMNRFVSVEHEIRWSSWGWRLRTSGRSSANCRIAMAAAGG